MYFARLLPTLLIVTSSSFAAAKFPEARQLLIHSDESLFSVRPTVRVQGTENADMSINGMQVKVPVSYLLEIGTQNRYHYTARLGKPRS